MMEEMEDESEIEDESLVFRLLPLIIPKQTNRLFIFGLFGNYYMVVPAAQPNRRSKQYSQGPRERKSGEYCLVLSVC